MVSLIELDSLEVQVLVDNEVDPISTYGHPGIAVSGQLRDVGLRAPLDESTRGGARLEIRLDNVCCGAHGLSLMIVSSDRRGGMGGNETRTMLTDPTDRPESKIPNVVQSSSTLPLKS